MSTWMCYSVCLQGVCVSSSETVQFSECEEDWSDEERFVFFRRAPRPPPVSAGLSRSDARCGVSALHKSTNVTRYQTIRRQKISFYDFFSEYKSGNVWRPPTRCDTWPSAAHRLAESAASSTVAQSHDITFPHLLCLSRYTNLNDFEVVCINCWVCKDCVHSNTVESQQGTEIKHLCCETEHINNQQYRHETKQSVIITEMSNKKCAFRMR